VTVRVEGYNRVVPLSGNISEVKKRVSSCLTRPHVLTAGDYYYDLWTFEGMLAGVLKRGGASFPSPWTVYAFLFFQPLVDLAIVRRVVV